MLVGPFSMQNHIGVDKDDSVRSATAQSYALCCLKQSGIECSIDKLDEKALVYTSID